MNSTALTALYLHNERGAQRRREAEIVRLTRGATSGERRPSGLAVVTGWLRGRTHRPARIATAH